MLNAALMTKPERDQKTNNNKNDYNNNENNQNPYYQRVSSLFFRSISFMEKMKSREIKRFEWFFL